jgi:hypothetical protein
LLKNIFYQKNNKKDKYTMEKQTNHKHTESWPNNKHEFKTFGAKMSQVNQESLKKTKNQ